VEYLKYMPVFRGIYQEIKKSMDLFKVYMRDLGTPLQISILRPVFRIREILVRFWILGSVLPTYY
jgi:hypothetical protein